jgi:ribosomal RNA-processing protein 9
MPDAFFQSDKKRKRSKPGRAGPSTNSRSKPAPRHQEKDEELESSAGEDGVDDMDFRAGRGGEDDMSDGEAIDENETAAEKRVRMAKGYLAKVRKELQDSESEEVYLKLIRQTRMMKTTMRPR